MALQQYLHIVRFQRVTGLPRDEVTNQFVTQQDDVAESLALADVHSALTELYTAAPAPMTKALQDWLSGSLVRLSPVHVIKTYRLTGHLDGSPHGSFIAASTFQLGSESAADTVPAEVALVATLLGEGRATAPAESGSQRPKARRTGHVYFGPFNVTSLQEISPQTARPNSALRADINQALKNLNTSLATAAPTAISLRVWSRAAGATYDVEGSTVDNEWDTQRRRGFKPTIKDTLTF